MTASFKGAAWNKDRRITKRMVIAGTLVLVTPAHFGNGDVTAVTDMPVHRDGASGRPILTGASLAGALRAALAIARGESAAEELFGAIRGTTAWESAVVVHDALGDDQSSEFRDGVAIDPKTRTAENKKKFDFELIPAGTTFPLLIELEVGEADPASLSADLGIALASLAAGRIRLGKRKTRGLGTCRVRQWSMRTYDMGNRADLVAWLKRKAVPEDGRSVTNIAVELGASDALPEPACKLVATFGLADSSLLIRSASGQVGGPDMVHLRSRRGQTQVPVLSGTSIAGALRARALRIANLLAAQPECGWDFVNGMFGVRARDGESPPLTASNLIVNEVEVIDAETERVQNRVAIDRFTGGSYPGALFSQQPVFGKTSTSITLSFELRRPDDAQVGMLLHLLKDLWTRDLPLGGESSIGRGRLTGRSATLVIGTRTWAFRADGQALVIDGDAPKLETYATALMDRLKEVTA